MPNSPRGAVMADNFDSNVAKRKPNITRRPRPIHPWDIHDISVDKNDVVPASDTVSPDKQPSLAHKKTRKPASVKPERGGSIDTSRITRADVSAKPSGDLSNAINIHSNYCKLDNAVSDHLFPKLSSSAQSVYLRLYRQSFGWNRNWAAESLPKLSKSCNLSLQTVRKAIKELESIGCINKEFSDYHKATVYRVYLPSEINNGHIHDGINTSAVNRGLNINSPKSGIQTIPMQKSDENDLIAQNSAGDSSSQDDVRKRAGSHASFRGQDTVIESLYFAGTSTYNLLESGGALPKNISKYINDTTLASAINIIDEFYDSIGFSIVSRAVYRKSLIDFFELVRSGFSEDDIRYAVRWTFNNSRSRPESFSLIKHTMHLAMDDLIRELKGISGEKDLAEQKREAVKRNLDWKKSESVESLSSDEFKLWLDIVEELRKDLNNHSFRAFIEPLKLIGSRDDTVTLSAPPDSISWIIDHYLDVIEKAYLEKTGKITTIEIT